MKSGEKIKNLLTALQGVKTALEGHLSVLESHAQNLASTHQVEVEHRQAMHDVAAQNEKILQSMFDWFSKPPGDTP